MINSGTIQFNQQAHPPPQKASKKVQKTIDENLEKGVEKATEEIAKDQEKNYQKFDSLVELTDRPIYKISAIFPFDFFPDEIVIDVTKITFIFKGLLYKRIHSINIKNISDIFVDNNFIFAAFTVTDQFFTDNTVTVKFLWKDEARKARALVQGLIEGYRQEIDFAKIDEKDLIEKIESLGKAHIDSKPIIDNKT